MFKKERLRLLHSHKKNLSKVTWTVFFDNKEVVIELFITI